MRVLFIALVLYATLSFSAQDPTAPPQIGNIKHSQEKIDVGELKVSAIFNFPGNHSAIINSRTVHVGDKTNGVRVLTIGTRTVTVENELGEKEILHLFKPLE